MSSSSTQAERIIKDKIFEKRGKIPDEKIKQLLILGDKDHIDDGLSRHGWQGGAVAVPIIVSDADAGTVVGSKWAIRGQISKTSIKASVKTHIYPSKIFCIIHRTDFQSIWLDGPKDVLVNLNFKGSDFEFGSRGSGLPANFR